MIDREVIREYLSEELSGIEIPKDIPHNVLIETFCRYIEDDYYNWIKDNFMTFFDDGDPDWDWIRERIRYSSKE